MVIVSLIIGIIVGFLLGAMFIIIFGLWVNAHQEKTRGKAKVRDLYPDHKE